MHSRRDSALPVVSSLSLASRTTLALALGAFALTSIAPQEAAASPEGACSKQAARIAQDVTSRSLKRGRTRVEFVYLIDLKELPAAPNGTRVVEEVYNVKLLGQGFTSVETEKYWVIRLEESQGTCSFVSASLDSAAG